MTLLSNMQWVTMRIPAPVVRSDPVQ